MGNGSRAGSEAGGGDDDVGVLLAFSCCDESLALLAERRTLLRIGRQDGRRHHVVRASGEDGLVSGHDVGMSIGLAVGA